MWIYILGFIVFSLICIFFFYLTKNRQTKNLIHNSISSSIAIIILILTIHIILMTLHDVPNYPMTEYDKIPTKTYSYIDTRYGYNTIYKVDYTIKYSKYNPPDSYDFLLTFPTGPDGFIEYGESSGKKIDVYADAPNDTLKIINEYKINPLLLHITYVSEETIDPEKIISQEPLPDIQNKSILTNSFYIKVRNTGKHDIKILRVHSNVNQLIDIFLIQLKNESWTNQPIMIYDDGLPITQTIIEGNGNMNWEINSLNSGEQKVYYFKKIDELTGKLG